MLGYAHILTLALTGKASALDHPKPSGFCTWEQCAAKTPPDRWPFGQAVGQA